MSTDPLFFATSEQWRAWLVTHHDSETELLVGYYKKGTGKPSMTWPESVDQALCFGWIDGVRRSLGEQAYAIRFTPRKAGSTWSAVNIARVRELTESGLMHPAGLAAYEQRAAERSAIYAYEQGQIAELEETELVEFRNNEAAWTWFERQAPSYRKAAIWWIVSAKRGETRRRRLVTLITDSANGKTVPPLTPRKAKTAL